MESIPSHVYVVMEKPYGMHHFKLACVYADRSSAERYVKNLYTDVVHMADLQRPGVTTYVARMPKSGKEITLRIIKEPLRTNPYAKKSNEEESQNEETHG